MLETGDSTAAEGGRKAAPVKKKKTTGFLLNNTVSTVGKALGGFPTNAQELAAQWSIGSDDTYTVSVKVLRQVEGSESAGLVADVPLRNYDAGRIAGQYGPGLYYIRASAGKYSNRATKMLLTEDYCRSNGWGSIPKPNPAESAAVQTIMSTTEGPTDPKALVMAVSQMIDSKLEAFQMRQGLNQPQPAGQAGADPMSAMEREMERMTRMMTMLNGLQEKARETVRAEMGLAAPAAEGKEENIWLKLAEIAAPVATAFMQKIGSEPRPVPQVMVPAQPQPARPALSQQAPAAPAGDPMPQLTEEERNAIGAAVQALKPYGETLVQLAAAGTDEQVVDNLDPWIPAGMVPSVMALSAIVTKHGPAVLQAIHPGLNTERWPKILEKLVEGFK